MSSSPVPSTATGAHITATSILIQFLYQENLSAAFHSAWSALYSFFPVLIQVYHQDLILDFIFSVSFPDPLIYIWSPSYVLLITLTYFVIRYLCNYVFMSCLYNFYLPQ